jgi:hypothetical protein
MATYWFHYEWRKGGKTAGESSIRFTAVSDGEAREIAKQYLAEFQKSHPGPGIKYSGIRILKEIRTIEEI